MGETCSACQTNPATTHLTEIVNKVKMETHYCALCYERMLRLQAKPKHPTEPGPDGYLWQLWEYDDRIMLQRRCDAPGCDKGLIYAPVRNCGACSGSGFKTRTFRQVP